MGQAQPLAGWCWVFSVVHAQMGPCSYIELRVWRCRTNRRTHHSDMPRTSGTYRNTWTDGFGCPHTMLAEYHHCQHLKMWNPSKRRRRSSRLASLLLRRKAAVTVFVLMSFRRLQKCTVEAFALSIPTRNMVISTTTWDRVFGCCSDDIAEVLLSQSHIR